MSRRFPVSFRELDRSRYTELERPAPFPRPWLHPCLPPELELLPRPAALFAKPGMELPLLPGTPCPLRAPLLPPPVFDPLALLRWRLGSGFVQCHPVARVDTGSYPPPPPEALPSRRESAISGEQSEEEEEEIDVTDLGGCGDDPVDLSMTAAVGPTF